MPSKSLLVFMLLALAVPASAQIVAFNEPFDNNGAGWTFVAPVTPGGGVSEWAIGPATAGGGVSYGNPDPGIDASASMANGVAGVVIGGDYSTIVHSYDYLVSPVVDTTSLSGVVVGFQRWLNTDYIPYVGNQVEVYDGTNWVVIDGPFPVGTIAESAWGLQSYDCSLYSNSAFQVRIGFEVTGGAWAYSGWNIDDFQIIDPAIWDATIACNPSGAAVDFSVVNGTPGNSFYIATAAVSTGVAPNGWFYGVDITFAELVAQVQLGNPFVGVVGPAGSFTIAFATPPGCGTFGISLDYVGLEYAAGLTNLVNVGTPKMVTL